MSKVQISRFQIVLALILSVLGTAIVTVPFMISQFIVRDAWMTGPCSWSAACCLPASRHCSFMRSPTDL
jgi:spore germination protein KB